MPGRVSGSSLSGGIAHGGLCGNLKVSGKCGEPQKQEKYERSHSKKGNVKRSL